METRAWRKEGSNDINTELVALHQELFWHHVIECDFQDGISYIKSLSEQPRQTEKGEENARAHYEHNRFSDMNAQESQGRQTLILLAIGWNYQRFNPGNDKEYLNRNLPINKQWKRYLQNFIMTEFSLKLSSAYHYLEALECILRIRAIEESLLPNIEPIPIWMNQYGFTDAMFQSKEFESSDLRKYWEWALKNNKIPKPVTKRILLLLWEEFLRNASENRFCLNVEGETATITADTWADIVDFWKKLRTGKYVLTPYQLKAVMRKGIEPVVLCPEEYDWKRFRTK